MKNSKKRSTLITAASLIVLFALTILLEQLIPTTSSWAMLLTVIKKSAVYALVAVSMNLLNGFTGLFSLGQAGFMLLGAYAYGIFTIPVESRMSVYQYYEGGLIQFTIPWPVALLLAGIVAAIFAFLIGLPVLRLKSDYLAIATLGFAEIIRAIFQWDAFGPITNGSNVLKDYVRFNSFKIGDVSLSTFAPVAIVVVCIAIIVLLINSSYGRAFKAIREDEIAAEAMGINLFKHKQLSFCTSSFFAGIGGALLAMFAGTVQAGQFKVAMTYELLLIVVIGGIGSVSGSVLASFLFIGCSEWWLRGLDMGTFLGINAPTLFRNGFRLVVFSVIIMIFVLFFRKGIMGTMELPEWLRHIKGKIQNKIASRKAKKEAAK
ncbi:MAG: branched-chain amino acid ABC transporter permease [Christensenellaceae bacterium]|nr:branched-chain amino acid ABC transporter permease [Christensenellaceae bacterium]